MFTQPSQVAYYVGFNKVNGIYQRASDCIMNNPEIKTDEEKIAHYANLLNTMYKGIRTPEVMAMEVDLFLKKNHFNNHKAPELPISY